jgi:hypothetical protein
MKVDDWEFAPGQWVYHTTRNLVARILRRAHTPDQEGDLYIVQTTGYQEKRYLAHNLRLATAAELREWGILQGTPRPEPTPTAPTRPRVAQFVHGTTGTTTTLDPWTTFTFR